MAQSPESDFLLMKAEWLAGQARSAGAVSAEIHRKPAGHFVVSCRVEGEDARYFEITVEKDGSLSLSWMRGVQIIKVTGLSAP